MYKICHVTTAHHKYDDRIFYKECVSLASAGFKVFLIAQSNQNEVVEGVNIIKLPVYKGRFKRMLLNSFISFFKILKTKSKVVHFHDPEFILTAFLLKICGKKIVYDMHELVYCQIQDKDWISNKFFKKIVAGIYKFIEKIAVNIFNRIVLAEDGYLSYFEKEYKSKLNKITFIRNFPVLKLLNQSKIDIKKENKNIILYAGGLSNIRGIREIIESLIYLSDNEELWLLGKFENEEYENLCKTSKGWEKVKYIGFVNHVEVYRYILQSNIGIAMLYPLPNYLTSLPVKAFEYMACEKPMIMSNFEYWQEVFKDVALFCNPTEPEEIANCIKYLINNKEKANEMALKGKKLILEEYSWEAESKRLVEMYNNLLKIKN